jgi:hypothetical protein
VGLINTIAWATDAQVFSFPFTKPINLSEAAGVVRHGLNLYQAGLDWEHDSRRIGQTAHVVFPSKNWKLEIGIVLRVGGLQRTRAIWHEPLWPQPGRPGDV